jgi:C-methyltransferase C-terminal domain/Putative zinc binding domain
VDNVTCRACSSRAGEIVLDLGEQPPCDLFPMVHDTGPDPRYPLQMWLCGACGLAQLCADPTVPEEPRGTEPDALISQAAAAVELAATSGLLDGLSTVAEYGSPHGGSWLGLLAERGINEVRPGDAADLIIDCFGLMHAADQRTALVEREHRLNPGGVLLLQFHALDAILRQGQWNALRHGHFGYYSVTSLKCMIEPLGLTPTGIWKFSLYGGTYLLAIRRTSELSRSAEDSIPQELQRDRVEGICDPIVLRLLQQRAERHASMLRSWLLARKAEGHVVLGYGAASRAVSLLVQAGVDRSILSAVVDASPTKQGRRMPGTNVPIVDPSVLADHPGAFVLLFVPDLLGEVRNAFPEVESAGGHWVDAEKLGSALQGA